MGICPSCSSSNADHARFCQSCGTGLSVDSPEQPHPDPQTRETPERETPDRNEPVYGGFWLRVVASIIDWLVVGVATGIIATAALGMLGIGVTLYIVTGWLYESLLTSSERQATLGKMAMGLVVTDQNGERLTFGRATGRHFAKYLSGMTLGIGYVMAAFTDRKQALHDLVAGTLVTG